MPRRAFCGAVLTALLIAACGGSSHSSSSPSSASSSSFSTAATTSAPATGTVSAGPTTTTATTSSRPPEVPKNRVPTYPVPTHPVPTHPAKHSKPTAPNTNVRIPAAFVVGAGGAITPPLIAVPPNVTIELALRNQDSLAHRVQLSVANFPTVSVPPGGSKTTDISGVAKGDYRLLVDGAPRARIVVGAVPGP